MIVDILVVGGGGGSANGAANARGAGGGGAGGVFWRPGVALTPGFAYQILVGGGGANSVPTAQALQGGYSEFQYVVGATGGGGGGAPSAPPPAGNGGNGFCGGGAGDAEGATAYGGVPDQFYYGGNNGSSAGGGGLGGGGGGVGVSGAGTGGNGSNAGPAYNLTPGGIGWWIDVGYGAVYYGAGGAGGQLLGGGNGVAGPAYTGQGAQGCSGNFSGVGAYGGQGIVMVRYPGAQVATGGQITSGSGYCIHQFLSNGYFTPPAAPTISTIDNTTTAAVNDAVVIQGTTAYTHIWGTGLLNGSSGVVSGTGVTAPFAAHGGDTLIALNITAAIDAPLGARTIYVTNIAGNSNTMTLTVVAPVPTLTGISTGQGGAPQGFVGIKTRVTITGTNFIVGGTNVYAPEGVTVTNVVVGSTTSLTCDFLGSGVTGVGVYVTTVGGTSNTIGFTMLAVTAITNAGMIVNHVLGAAYNSHPGTLGMYFTVGAKDRLVTHLGRFKWGTNSKKHILTLRDSAWQDVARTIIDLSVGAGDVWQYAPLATPVVLKKGLIYVLADMDNSGVSGEYWAGQSSVATDGNATVNGFIVEASSMFRFTRGADRVDPYTLGFSFIAQAGYTVTALGRWKIPGNSRTHIVVLKDAAGTIVRQVTVDFTSGKGLDNAFNYVSVPLLVLTTGARYFLESEEMQGDVWPNYPNTITPWGGLNITDSCYEGSQYPVNGVIPTLMGTGPNTSHSMPDILCLITQSSGYSESYVTMNLLWKDALQPMAMII